MKTVIHLLMLTMLIAAMCSCTKASKEANPPVTDTPVVKGKRYYVSDGAGADANDGSTTASAFKTIAAGINAASAGDTVFVMKGIYPAAVSIAKSGAANAYITIKAYPSDTPRIYISGNVWNAFSINGNYIVVDGLELQGDNANITYDDALAAYNAAVAGGAPSGKYNTNGFSIGGPGASSAFPHHVTIRHCIVHDFPGGGISSIQADYTTIEDNLVYNNAWYMMYGGSGISILTPFNSDGADVNKYKNIVRNNICYTNKTTIPWISTKALSDGNGIIIDVNQSGYDGTGAAYEGRTLVENNVSFNNGGSGIHSYKADHVDIINNTAYGNGTMVGYADIFASNATDVKIANNIMYARNGGKCTSPPSAGTNVTYDYNLNFNGTTGTMGSHDKVADPMFVHASANGVSADLSLSAGSPGIDAGTTIIYSKKDINGIARPQGAGVDCGAYEHK